MLDRVCVSPAGEFAGRTAWGAARAGDEFKRGLVLPGFDGRAPFAILYRAASRIQEYEAE